MKSSVGKLAEQWWIVVVVLCAQAFLVECDSVCPEPKLGLGMVHATGFGNAVGTIRVYACRRGFERIHSRPSYRVCLENGNWSENREICQRSSNASDLGNKVHWNPTGSAMNVKDSHTGAGIVIQYATADVGRNSPKPKTPWQKYLWLYGLPAAGFLLLLVAAVLTVSSRRRKSPFSSSRRSRRVIDVKIDDEGFRQISIATAENGEEEPDCNIPNLPSTETILTNGNTLELPVTGADTLDCSNLITQPNSIYSHLHQLPPENGTASALSSGTGDNSRSKRKRRSRRGFFTLLSDEVCSFLGREKAGEQEYARLTRGESTSSTSLARKDTLSSEKSTVTNKKKMELDTFSQTSMGSYAASFACSDSPSSSSYV